MDVVTTATLATTVTIPRRLRPAEETEDKNGQFGHSHQQDRQPRWLIRFAAESDVKGAGGRSLAGATLLLMSEPPPVGTHTEHENDPWTIEIPDHPARTDSPGFVAARAAANRIMATLTEYPYGPGPWQMHHAGSLWTYDGQGWFLVLNPVGSEWSAQWCADPAKVDAVRQNAVRHYAGFPQTIPQMTQMGYADAETILNSPITNAEQISVYVDSIFNSCVPMAGIVHTGIVTPQTEHGGIHHYPKPIVDIQFFKRDDFQLWVVDQQGQLAAVAPLAPRFSGDGRVQVLYATPNTNLATTQQQAESVGKMLILPPEHPLAQQAFVMQQDSGS
jgi:hypothetical protein